MLRFVILAGEFHTITQDPAFADLAEKATQTCQKVDQRYTDRFLQEAAAQRKM